MGIDNEIFNHQFYYKDGFSMLVTFSINKVMTPDKMKKIDKLVHEINDHNREYLSDAFFKIMGCEDKEYISLKYINKKGGKFEKLNALRHPTYSFEEMMENYEEVDSYDITIEESFEDEVIMNCDTDNLVKEFLDLRDNLFLLEGIDIWRLLELSLFYEDRIAIRKLANHIVELGYIDFFTYLLQSEKAIQKLKEIFSKGV